MIHVSMPGAVRALVLLFSTAAAAVGLGACERTGLEPAPRPMDVDTYVSVMSELVHVDRFPPPGSDYATREARADSLRRAILDRYGVTTEEMLEYAQSAGQQPGLMLEISDRIVEITDSLARLRREGADTARHSPAAETGDTTLLDTAAARDSALAPRDTVRSFRPLRERSPRSTPTPTP